MKLILKSESNIDTTKLNLYTMHPIKKLLFNALCLISLAVLAQSCTQGNKPNKPRLQDSIINSKLDPLPDENISNFLDSTKIVAAPDSLKPEQVLTLGKKRITFNLFSYLRKLKKGRRPFALTEQARLFNTLTPNELKLADLFTTFRDKAANMCRKNFVFPGDPRQTKIGYSWGSKQYLAKVTPPGEADYCKYKIHGVDCSGFIFQLFFQSGLKMDSSIACSGNEKNPQFLKRSLDPYFGGPNNYTVTDLKRIDTSKIISGDLLYFKNTNGAVVHIAIALREISGQLSYYASLGGPVKGKSGINLGQCTVNLNNGHGPILKVLDIAFLEDKRAYGVVRIAAK